STLTVKWIQVNGPGTVIFVNPNAPVTTAFFSVPGSYVLRLTVSDSELSVSDEVNVTVIPENHAPLVQAGADQTISLPTIADLNGTVSDDGLPEGSTLITTWTKFSGPGDVVFTRPDNIVTTASFSMPGTYVLRLTAGDSQLSSSDEIQIIVVPENHRPTVNAGPDQSIAFPASASLSGTVNDDGLPAGSTITSTWSKISGPGSVNFTNPASTVT